MLTEMLDDGAATCSIIFITPFIDVCVPFGGEQVVYSAFGALSAHAVQQRLTPEFHKS